MPGKGQAVFYKNAKVITIGNSDTDKSSLNRALAGEPFVPEIPVETHQIRLLNRQEKSYNDGGKEVRETFLWDPGGRSGYRLTHQLHLQDVSVVLVLLDVRSDEDAEAGVREWARSVQRIKGQYSRAMKMFLVITHKGRGGGGSRYSRRIQDLKKNLSFDDVFETSAKEGWGIDELRQAILEAIDWEKLPRMSSVALQEITKLLIDKEQEGQRFYLEDELYNAFKKKWSSIVRAHNEDLRARFETCIRYIEIQGLIRRLSSGNYILLQPELFDIYASALLDAARDDPDGFGCIDVDSARQGKFSLAEESDRVKDRALERMLLDSIEHDFLSNKIAFYGITFRECEDGPEQQISLIFPSQSFRVNADLPDPRKKYYSFHFYREVTSLYWRLVAHLSSNNPFAKQGLWRNAVTYTSESGEMCGVSLYQHNETHGELAVFFDDGVSEETRKLFAAYIYVYLRSHDKRAWGKPVIRCPCGCIFNEDQERKARERGKSTITCPCGESTVRLPGTEEPITRYPDLQQPDYIVEARRRAERVWNRKKLNDHDVLFFCNDDEEDKREIGEICNELEKRDIVTWFEERDMPPGKLKLSEIADQMQQIKAAVICYGNKNDNSRWQDLQMESLMKQFIKRGCAIIPVLLIHAPLKKPELPDYFNTRWVDFHDWKLNPIDQLIWGITGERP